MSDDLISEESVDDTSFSCSTPKYSKISELHLLPQNMKCIESKIITAQSKQFYSVHPSTEISFENIKRENVLINPISFQDLGGLNEQISDIKSLINSFLAQDSEMKKNHSGIILIGACGTGKSILVQALGNAFHLPVFSLNKCKFSRDKEELKFQLQNFFKKSVENSPSLLFLDNIDTFCKDYNTSNLQSGFSTALLLSTMLYDILNSDYQTVVISAARNIFDVDVSLRKPGLLEKEIYFGTPSSDDRKEILNKILRRISHTLSQEEISEISAMTHGFTGGDLRQLCDKAIISAQRKACDIVAFLVAFEDVKEAIKNVKPSSVAEFKFEVPNIKWSDIGGMQEVKIAITEMVYWPIKHSEQFKKLKIEPARGILMYGPPGCSKTMIAKALASESQLNFIPVKGTELYNKYVGESEKALSEIFKKARSASPCILFFDEIDSIAPIRGSLSGNSNVTDRILNQLLIEIDGIDVLQSQVHIVAATNLPGNIDKSLLRPGRFNKIIYVPLPDATTRKEIFQAKLENKPVAKDINIPLLVEATEGYTGAEISDICLEAAVFAMKDHMNTSKELFTSVLTLNNFMSALDSVKPRTSEEMLKSYEEFKFDVKRM